MESQPLIDEELNVALENPKSMAKSTRTAIAIGSLLSLCAVAAFSYNSPVISMTRGPMSSVMNMESDDLAVCKNTYIYGVTPRAAQKGCVILSNGDLYGSSKKSAGQKTVTICVGSSYPGGTVELNAEHLASLDLSALSGISPGVGVDVQTYSGPNFDGDVAYVSNANQDGRLSEKDYPSGTNTNDNVQSIKIITDVSGYFAGHNCGEEISVCTDTRTKASDLNSLPPDGCIILANIDPTADGHENSHAKTVRICASNDVGAVEVDADALTDMGLIQRAGRKESSISFISRGKLVDYVQTFQYPHFGGAAQQSTGVLTRQEYEDGSKVADNVFSLKFESKSPVAMMC